MPTPLSWCEWAFAATGGAVLVVALAVLAAALFMRYQIGQHLNPRGRT